MTHDAVTTLREQIVMGAIPPGTPLRLEELARQLDMSVSPVREAVRQLEMVGLAEHVAYKGARVTYLSSGELEVVEDTRLALESLAARHTAARYGDETDRRLTAILADLDVAYETPDRARIVHGNTAFHLALAAGSGSPLLERLIAQTLEIWERYSAALILVDHPEETYADEARGHHEIVDACRDRDPDAAEAAIRRHIGTSRAIFERGGVPSPALAGGQRDGV
jgi:DNA-binding GntR family transcriptional regulator